MPLRSHQDEEPALNLTSIIDVLLVLIIFFMASTKFTELERRIGLQVPKVSGAGALSDAPVPKTISVYKDGQITLAGKNISLEELVNDLASSRRQYKQMGVVIRGDKMTPHGRMAEVYNACKQAGVAELAISVKVDTVKRW